MQQAEKVWRRETEEFSFEDFKEEYPQYDIPDDQINRYPEYDQIREQIEIILEDGIMPIMMDEEYELNYHRGVHLCIDNCANNGITSDGMLSVVTPIIKLSIVPSNAPFASNASAIGMIPNISAYIGIPMIVATITPNGL